MKPTEIMVRDFTIITVPYLTLSSSVVIIIFVLMLVLLVMLLLYSGW